MKMFLTGLLFVILLLALDANAQFKPSEQQYLEQTNLAFNSGFEQGLRNWTNANGVFSVDSTNFVLGKKSGKVALTAQTLDFSQTLSTGYNTALSGLQGHVAAYAKSDFPFQVCALIDGVESNCVNGSGDNKFDFYDIPIVLGSTSLGIKFKSLTSYTGSIYVDGVEYGHKQFVSNVAQSEFVGSIYFNDNNCIFDRASTSYGVLTSASACSPNILSSNLSFPNSTEMGIQINNAKVGTYRVEFQGLLYNSGNLNSCYFTLSTTGNKENQGEVFAGVGNAGNRADSTLLGNFEVTTEGDFPIKIITRSTGGTNCRVYGQVGNQSRFNIYYHPPQSQIVRQSQELDVESDNSFTAIVATDGTVSGENHDWLNGNCSVVSAVYTCNFNTGVFNETPSCVTTSEATVDVTTIINSISSTTMNVESFNTTSGGATGRGFHLHCSKSGTDYNKSQIVYGQFEQIKSTELCQVRGEGGLSTHTNNLPMTFTEVSDNCNAWDGDEYTAQKDGYILFQGNFQYTTVRNGTILLFKNGSQYQNGLSHQDSVSAAYPFTFIAEAQQGDTFYISFNNSATLTTAASQRYISITEVPDTASIVKNLNDNKNVVCSTKYLTANFNTSGGVISDLGFSGLTIGKKYRIGVNLRATFNNTDTLNIEYKPVGGGDSIIFPALAGVNGVTPSTFASKIFTATTTSIEAIGGSITAGNALIGSGTQDVYNSWTELCELPDNYVEGSF